jgi:hypothetical protein
MSGAKNLSGEMFCPPGRRNVRTKKHLWRNEHFDADGDSGLSSSQCRCFEYWQYLVNGSVTVFLLRAAAF